MGLHDHFTAAQFIEAIAGSGGIISTIAARVGCSWNTAQKYIRKYATVARAYQDECEKTLDVAEAVIIKSIRQEDVQTAKWYLTLKGRERGYMHSEYREVEQRTELSGGVRIEQDDDRVAEVLRILAEAGALESGAAEADAPEVD